MKLCLRYCQRCGARALTPKSGCRPGMRNGFIYRKNHDLCGRCFREAWAEGIRLWRAARSRRLGARPAERRVRVGPSKIGEVA